MVEVYHAGLFRPTNSKITRSATFEEACLKPVILVQFPKLLIEN